MNTIEQAREVVKTLRLRAMEIAALGNAGWGNTMIDASNTIDALLAERDAEIEQLKTVPMKYRRMAFNAQLQDEVAAQRKVLEQVKEAMQQLLPRNGYEGGVAVWRLGASHAVTEAITAIQEQLA